MKNFIFSSLFSLNFLSLGTSLDPNTFNHPIGLQVIQLSEGLVNFEVGGAQLYLDKKSDEMSVSLFPKIKCNPNSNHCPRVMPIVKELKTPVTERFTDECNIKTTIGVLDQTSFDGPRVKITLQDLTQTRCLVHYTRFNYSYRVYLEVFNPWTQETKTAEFVGYKK